MNKSRRPIVGLTLDAEATGTYSKSDWYALRANYTDAIVATGGLPLALPHHTALTADYLEIIDALVVTGGAFDVDPALYGDDERHNTVILKTGRTAAEMALTKGALAQQKPVLGICGGEQLLAVALGGSLIQHIPESIPDALPHEQPNPRHEPGHSVTLTPGTKLAAIVGTTTMQVNSSHHQAIRTPGAGVINARAPDGVIEGIEDSRYKFCLGVQWHPEYFIDPGDRRIFEALIAACLE